MKYVLPISPDYISEWSDWHAVRELLQNAMDAQDRGGEKPIVDYNEASKTLIVASPKERLSRKSLLLGATTKADDRGQRGQFGEGYKLAILVLCRKLYGVAIHNGGETWTAAFEPCADFDNEPVLTINVNPSLEEDYYDGVRFVVKEFPESAWALICERWLPDSPHDSILPWEQHGNIYSGGLFITKVTSLLRGYNFAPHRLNLGRDRDVVGDFDIKYHTSTIWKQCSVEMVDELMGLLKVAAGDVEYVDYVPAQQAQAVVRAFEKEYGEGTVPVANQKELDQVRSSGFNGQIVCDALRKIVTGTKKFIFHELRTPGGKMKSFFDKVKDRLDLDVREELEILVRESAGWR